MASIARSVCVHRGGVRRSWKRVSSTEQPTYTSALRNHQVRPGRTGRFFRRYLIGDFRWSSLDPRRLEDLDRFGL